ncbi:MAG TPA: hypothetical protein PK878_19040 [bacterium]|nr:hypothetical protein [Candidatus Omnitrophota bacterium]HOJ62381.1 hypothetical protein [bacterium]HOL92903.1 hypothetical protein [bacterium]HPO99965.1 hypothetical protein [bacterium]HXK92541.1 hypothetical protein [bacterium]
MPAPAPAFDVKIAQDLTALIEKLSHELKKQDDWTDPKVLSLFRLYLSAIRQYLALKKHGPACENPHGPASTKQQVSTSPAASPKPANTNHPQISNLALSLSNLSRSAPQEPFPAPGLLRSTPAPTSSIPVRMPLSLTAAKT